ncbi:MAG: hypothetical protein A2V66_14710 [Ignavibacteria bacterium RBG_13_36_8]|nr:MAG: hypothetical protein A2V66_14710 [Ignavibacteria bacterium RBG_13_36_8]
MSTFVVYIIRSQSTGLHYIGHTSNLEDRLTRHDSDRSKFTKGKGPWELITTKECVTKSEAYQLEMK